MIKAVVIDFDDTLCLTEEGCFALENETLRRLGRAPMSREVHKKTWGLPLGEAMLLRSPGIDLNPFWHIMPIVHEEFIQQGRVDVVPEANIAALDGLAKLGLELMILTSRTHTEVKHLLDHNHHLTGRLNAFYHKDNTKFHKPDPRVFDVIERDHGLLPNEYVYVGDSPGDAAAACGAGLQFIACLESGLRTKDDFEDYAVSAYIDTFSAINTVLETTARSNSDTI